MSPLLAFAVVLAGVAGAVVVAETREYLRATGRPRLGNESAPRAAAPGRMTHRGVNQ